MVYNHGDYRGRRMCSSTDCHDLWSYGRLVKLFQMRKLFEIVKIGWQAKECRVLYNQIPRRGVTYQENLKWVKPEKKPVHHPARAGDLVEFPAVNYEAPYLPFKDSKELESSDEKVKKIFSLGYQLPKEGLVFYENELVGRVKSHKWDDSSEEVRIAKLSAKIRYYRKVLLKRPSKNGPLKTLIKILIDRRRKKLKELRLMDYKRFEWLLDKLELEYRPPVDAPHNRVTRKKSLMLLARLKVEQAKEEKLAELKKKLDEEKIPFLEKKITKLKEMKEMEEKYNLPVTVNEEDIEECVRKLEEVKIQVKERMKKGYKKKIHPYFLEAYDEESLWNKEKEGELIREKLESEKQKEVEKGVL